MPLQASRELANKREEVCGADSLKETAAKIKFQTATEIEVF